MKIIQPPDMNAANGSFEFKWRPDFGAVMTQRLNKAQQFIDSECMRLMVPYTPRRNECSNNP